jgi:hypothetical protein
MADYSGTIFMTKEAYDQLGTNWPKKVVKGYFEDAMAHNDLVGDADVSSDNSFSPYAKCNVDSYDSSQYKDSLDCVLEEFDSWVTGHPDEGTDFNLCLCLKQNYDDSNTAVWGETSCGNASVVRGAEEINDVTSSLPRYGTSRAHWWAKTSIHEIGHNIGVEHADGIVTQKTDTIGDDECAITPHDPDGSTNNCGTSSFDRSNYSTHWYDKYFYYHCAGDDLRDQSSC